MTTTPSQLQFVQEVPTATVGDTVPNAPVGSLILFSDGGVWYSKDSAGTVNALAGITNVTATDTSIVVTVAGTTRTISRAAITGDISISAGANVATLPNVNGSSGTTGDASHVAQVITNAKGQVTGQSAIAIQITESQVTNLTSDLAGKQATGNYITALTGDVAASGPGSAAATLAAFGTAQTIGDASHVPAVTTDAKGRVSGMNSTPIVIAESAVTNLVTDLAAKFPNSAGVAQPKEIAGVAYITAGNPQGWAGSDVGAWINAAWAYLIGAYPQIGGAIKIGPGVFTWTTPSIVGTQFAACSIEGTPQGFGGSSGAALGAVGGTVLNYTPTSGIALTIGGTNNNGGGVKLSDFAIQGTGIGNGATAIQVGIQSGATGANAFASQAGATHTNVTINGFTNGWTWNTASHVAYGQTFVNCKTQYCTNGFTPFGEANVMFGGLVGNCVTGILGNINGSDMNCFGTAFDDNTTTAINVSQPLFRMTLTGCRFENAGGGTDVYITQSDGSITVLGGSIQSDIVAVGTATGFVQATGGVFYLVDTWVYNSSANRTFTQLFNVSSGVKSFKAEPVVSPSSAAGISQWFNTAASAWPRQGNNNPQTNSTAVLGTAASAATYFNADTRGGFPLPAGARAGTTIRVTAMFSNIATVETVNMKLTLGTGNAATDGTLVTFAPAAGTATAGSAMVQYTFVLTSATTAQVDSATKTTPGFGGAAATFSGAITVPIAVVTSSATFLGLYFASTVANVCTARSVTWEILSN